MGFLNSSWGKGQPTQPAWHSLLLYKTLFNFLLEGHWFRIHGTVAVMSCVWNGVVMYAVAHQPLASRSRLYGNCFVFISFQMREERGRLQSRKSSDVMLPSGLLMARPAFASKCVLAQCSVGPLSLEEQAQSLHFSYINSFESSFLPVNI